MPAKSSPAGRAASEALAGALNSAAIHFLRAVRKVDRASGLSPARLSALSVLVFGGPRSAKQLAEAEGVKAPSITPLVQALEQQGLLRREPDPKDARAVLLSATTKGRKVLEQGRKRRIAAIAAALKQCSADERAVLERAARLLEELSRRI
jgi:DNA-binding MarR family transcriptional regulator